MDRRNNECTKVAEILHAIARAIAFSAIALVALNMYVHTIACNCRCNQCNCMQLYAIADAIALICIHIHAIAILQLHVQLHAISLQLLYTQIIDEYYNNDIFNARKCNNDNDIEEFNINAELFPLADL